MDVYIVDESWQHLKKRQVTGRGRMEGLGNDESKGAVVKEKIKGQGEKKEKERPKKRKKNRDHTSTIIVLCAG